MINCTKCKKEKTVDEMPKDMRRRHGLSSICKECSYGISKSCKEKKHDHYKDYIREYMRKYRDKKKAKEPSKSIMLGGKEYRMKGY